ncbi:adenosylmethionine--8-amino-7-oxononanoate transaminase [Helicobacter ailurogastricus]|uniref:Adenosylmethionine-8-amino-7-oxononanoate aminotransferase n=1 Tax=Helicobacter ailurogastricus TaxID=1578720 RepID=A0A0K2X8S3_9HELI|nr:adenosylmethionine--8-amino-7-oxononanoate transaminase [Helicobacter ailurogastricus]CRF40853.1 Adenosylmethionine-8-amino-7-oxononanoate aminotransferase [Helicobacter ailurogastricus]CRF42892.1 Adenosylmethionine-8-amino-7-oxononanoate aminotransferase [Helicobacter ailurogastricus]CRF44042.1 Adenosylmethionine-8-amino-7-oxononanoate aminotransferase [Helicobacter ailurogastricus]GLH57318.1 Adenosylmethionine-8-amino-7-oxononanoate aminotransferase BioA [Helicobacter ailurogastricus]GLH5
MTNDGWHALDVKHIWHPCSQMHDYIDLPLLPIKSAKGVYLYDFEGNRYIDAISSWWVNLFGHNHPYINQKLKEQIDTLEHVLLAGLTHPQAINLAARLCALSGFEKCFFADNGSACVEVALKMSYHSHLLEGKQKPKFLSLENGYHGETLGALSVGAVGLYKDTYKELFCQHLQTPVPKNEADVPRALQALQVLLQKEHKNISAFILEPLIQCAGNMHFYSADFVKQATKMCQALGVHVIFDEIAVGFGRTGSLFAFEQCQVKPDFLCLSKGITGGYLPLAVVLTTNSIYEQFYAPYEQNKSFLHSHSYTGNALACACANATLDLFEQGVVEKNKKLSADISAHLQERLGSLKGVKNLRACGMVFAFELTGYKGTKRLSLAVFQKGLELGILLRPLADTIYFMPAYTITPQEVLESVGAMAQVVRALT